MPKNLIVLRNGRDSLHENWCISENKNWDILFCPFDKTVEFSKESFFFYGQKWSGLYGFLCENYMWTEYDFICFPDDDIFTDGENWNLFFEYCNKLNVKLAAPALSKDSYFIHPTTIVNENFIARKTTFIEIMNPCFSVDFLKEAIKTFDLSRTGTGFGLDFLWPAMLNYDDIWIIDATPVKHTKPIGRQRNKYLAEISNYEANFFINLGVPVIYSCSGGILLDGSFISYDENEFMRIYIDGFSYLKYFRMDLWSTISNIESIEQPPYEITFNNDKLFKVINHFDISKNTISRGKPSKQSSVSEWSWSSDANIEASGGNDGLINGVCGFHTNLEINPWWEVDLLEIFYIDSIYIYNRLDLKERFKHFSIQISLDGYTYHMLYAKSDDMLFGGFDGYPFVLNLEENVKARYLKITATGETYLHLDQIDVFGRLMTS